MTHHEIHALNHESRYGYVPVRQVRWYERVWRVLVGIITKERVGRC